MSQFTLMTPTATARPEDLAATMLHLLGIDPETGIHDALNQPPTADRGRQTDLRLMA